jgi:hypothetical protein
MVACSVAPAGISSPTVDGQDHAQAQYSDENGVKAKRSRRTPVTATIARRRHVLGQHGLAAFVAGYSAIVSERIYFTGVCTFFVLLITWKCLVAIHASRLRFYGQRN